MKKAMAILGAILLVIGLGMSWTGRALGGESRATVRLFGRSWSVYAPEGGSWGGARIVRSTSTGVYQNEPTSTPSAVAVEVVGEKAFSEICLDLEVANVTVAAGDDYLVEISCWGDGYQVQRVIGNGMLFLWSESDSFVTGATCGSDITIYVPADEKLEYVSAQLDLGSITLAGLTMDWADLDVDLGDVIGEDLTVCGYLHVDADLGAVTLYGDLDGSVEIDANLGDVTLGLAQPASHYCWDLTASLGSVTVDRRSYNGISSSDAGGSGDAMLHVDTDVGNIQVDFNCPMEQNQATIVDSGLVAEEVEPGTWVFTPEPTPSVSPVPEPPTAPSAPEAPKPPTPPAVPAAPSTE